MTPPPLDTALGAGPLRAPEHDCDYSDTRDEDRIGEVLSAPRSPWQNPYAERLIGSIRRDCLDHVIIVNERHLQRILQSYFAYYHQARPHRSLDQNAPQPRKIEPPERGRIVAEAMVGGL